MLSAVEVEVVASIITNSALHRRMLASSEFHDHPELLETFYYSVNLVSKICDSTNRCFDSALVFGLGKPCPDKFAA